MRVWMSPPQSAPCLDDTTIALCRGGSRGVNRTGWCCPFGGESTEGWDGSASSPWRASASCGKTCGSVEGHDASASWSLTIMESRFPILPFANPACGGREGQTQLLVHGRDRCLLESSCSIALINPVHTGILTDCRRCRVGGCSSSLVDGGGSSQRQLSYAWRSNF
jgi:hypothetical protein